MKRLLSFLLTTALFLSVFTACRSSEEEGGVSTTDTSESNGWLLPTTIADSRGEFELTLLWDENSCTFEADNTTIRFTYDEEKGSLSVLMGDYAIEDLCVFDGNGRITTIRFDGYTVTDLSYDGETMILSAWGEDELDSPKEVIADWSARKMLTPPFDDPNEFLYFTEWGDLIAVGETTVGSYTYDDEGNALSIAMPDLGDYSWNLSYGDAAMTEAWQRAVVKFMMTASLGRPMIYFAMDMMCFAVYQQYGVDGI